MLVNHKPRVTPTRWPRPRSSPESQSLSFGVQAFLVEGEGTVVLRQRSFNLMAMASNLILHMLELLEGMLGAVHSIT